MCDKQSLIKAESDELKHNLAISVLEKPKIKSNSIGIGCTVSLTKNRTSKSVFIAGDWSMRTGTQLEEAFVVSAQSPIAQACIGKYPGDDTMFGKITSFKQVEVK